jgi:hypothetical protein
MTATDAHATKEELLKWCFLFSLCQGYAMKTS